MNFNIKRSRRITNMRILLTGGAGFIGSNLVEALLEDDRVKKLVVLDNLSTGFKSNIEGFLTNPKFTFIEGDIREYFTCLDACKNIDVVSHQAALGSVPRSINDPLTSNEVNISGTLNVFNAARTQNVRKIVYASSSSVYGDDSSPVKSENVTGKPLSPYAVTKSVNEIYANLFPSLYDTKFIGLRYFNVFGPKQSPEGPYAAVIPLFINAILKNSSPVINGDGLQSRDFTYISNVVQANINAIFCENDAAWNQVYNIAAGEKTAVVEVYKVLLEIIGKTLPAKHGPERPGEIKDSLANISKAKELLDYDPKVRIKEGLKMTVEWFRKTS